MSQFCSVLDSWTTFVFLKLLDNFENLFYYFFLDSGLPKIDFRHKILKNVFSIERYNFPLSHPLHYPNFEPRGTFLVFKFDSCAFWPWQHFSCKLDILNIFYDFFYWFYHTSILVKKISLSMLLNFVMFWTFLWIFWSLGC